MLVKILKILLIFLFAYANTQNSICYSNCKQGHCAIDTPSKCTMCDKGQAILNNKCIPTNTQPYPLKYLTFDGNNSITRLPSQSTTFSCQVFNGSSTLNKLGSLLYMIVLGSTFTKRFYIAETHSYIQLKFNAAVVQSSPVILQYKLFAADGTILLSNRQAPFTSTDTNLSIQCMNNTTVPGVYFVSQSLSTTQQNLTFQVSSLDGNAMLGVSNFQIFYGSCNRKCQTCSGPTQTQCLSCQGLYMQLVNGECQTCPTGYYDNGVQCLLCSQNCNSCIYSNQTEKMTCTSCMPWSQLNQGNCITTYETFSLPQQLIYNSSYGWLSSQTSIQPFSRCGQYSLIGGIPYGIQNSIISKTFTELKVHSLVDIKLVFWMIDQQPDDTNMFQIQVDGVVITQKQVNIISPQHNWVLTDQCGNTNPQLQFIVNLTSIPHSAENITVAITSIKNYFGFRDFILVVNNHTNVIGCQSQLNGVCITCRKGFHYNPTKKSCNQCSDNYYLTKTQDSCEICPIECQTCQLQTGIDKIQCLTCPSPLELVNGYCKDPIGAVYTREIIPNGIQSLRFNSWTMYPKLPNNGITQCGNNSILGSKEVRYKFLQMSRKFINLPSHKGVKIYFHFYQIDSYSNKSVYFVINGKYYNYSPTIERKQICGNPNIPDAIVKLQFTDENHSDESFQFQIHANEQITLGVNNIILFLLNCYNCNNVIPFKFQSIPLYSLNTPPVKGIKIKLMFDEEIINSTTFYYAIQFSIVDSQQNLSRLLQGLISNDDSLPITWEQIVANKQYRTFLQLTQDYSKSQIKVDPVYFWALSTDPNQNDPPKLLSSSPVTKSMPRYIDIDQTDIYDRTNIRNLRNLFSGCATFALWMGLASFIFGFSCAFDDFFILIQVIFVHIFIQLPYSPPSLRLPLQSMQIVQFMTWLPWQARIGIENGIIPNDLYQRSPIVYELYYRDIVYVRTIYHTLLFFTFMAVVYILLLVIAHILKSSPKSKKKYADNYIAKYYSDYEANKFSYIDKCVRFAYFTVVWACTLQFTAFKNTPTSFNIWNSILCISMFVIFILYPIVGFLWLRKKSGEMSESTFRKKYQHIRIDSSRMFHFIWKYYKLLLIALLIGLLYDSNPLGVLIPLIIVHVLDGLIVIFMRPFGMHQEQQLNVCLYNYYPKVYQITSIIQPFIFAFLQLFIIILYAVRNTATNHAYLGLGYFCCVIIVALLINGILRLSWGFIKMVEECFAKSKEMKLVVQNKAFKEKQSNQQLIPMKSMKQLQSNLNNLQSKERLNTIRKTTLVSKIN